MQFGLKAGVVEDWLYLQGLLQHQNQRVVGFGLFLVFGFVVRMAGFAFMCQKTSEIQSQPLKATETKQCWFAGRAVTELPLHATLLALEDSLHPSLGSTNKWADL